MMGEKVSIPREHDFPQDPGDAQVRVMEDTRVAS
jgi:hypothetical protein